jgi:hypothetical protein
MTVRIHHMRERVKSGERDVDEGDGATKQVLLAADRTPSSHGSTVREASLKEELKPILAPKG